ncbi:MAG: ABC transporter substrate-binding protein [Burkholderiales bacterium]|nr:ABC transporter substrate-binding protein [Burkholderiales bacterium]
MRLLRGRRYAETDQISFKDLLLILLVIALILGAVGWFAFRFVRPAPPNTFVISTGAENGAYHLFGERYRELLAKEKLRVELRPSTGSVENLQRLLDWDAGVDVAFIQGGVGDPEANEGLVSLAAVYYEPLWIFYRGRQNLHLLSQLAGKRVAIGPEGSGTRALALHLLAASGLSRIGKRFSTLGGTEATQALIDGKLDAIMLVAAPDAPIIQQMLRAPGIHLMNLSQAEALSRRFSYLSAVSLPRGVIDLGADIPATNVTLIATTAYLVAREDFHPALVSMLLQAAAKTHSSAGLLRRAGEFPAPRDGDFPLSEDARRYFASGPPFLQRYMPFWVANLIERLLVLIVPLIAVMIPLFRIIPALYNWRVKARVFRWYRELMVVEAEAHASPAPGRVAELLQRLQEIEDGVSGTRVPLHYTDYVYTLRLHINMVRSRLTEENSKTILAADKSG